jgi:hypothetical protein
MGLAHSVISVVDFRAASFAIRFLGLAHGFLSVGQFLLCTHNFTSNA